MLTAYTVTAELPDEAIVGEFVRWLNQEHVPEVLQAGAMAAQIVRIADTDGPIRVEVRYTFATAELLDEYLRHSAPTLRAKGAARFPPERGIRYTRSHGTILGVFPPNR